ncbi:hypothetical protein HPB48_005317 [Haemaphysalis longicornis]|uniref:Uncharacterized protein n=1 Tax=Haemaphysalis longicornis TaxID=44386 RepID=A0A9J6GHN8_HAELO|nr:hypothetical protein HPB48_005317 [Haemaphysalis longicornis]
MKDVDSLEPTARVGYVSSSDMGATALRTIFADGREQRRVQTSRHHGGAQADRDGHRLAPDAARLDRQWKHGPRGVRLGRGPAAAGGRLREPACVPSLLSWRPDAPDTIAYVSGRGPLHAWSVPEGPREPWREAAQFSSAVTQMTWHPTGKLAMGHQDGSLSVLQSGESRVTYTAACLK